MVWARRVQPPGRENPLADSPPPNPLELWAILGSPRPKFQKKNQENQMKKKKIPKTQKLLFHFTISSMPWLYWEKCGYIENWTDKRKNLIRIFSWKNQLAPGI